MVLHNLVFVIRRIHFASCSIGMRTALKVFGFLVLAPLLFAVAQPHSACALCCAPLGNCSAAVQGQGGVCCGVVGAASFCCPTVGTPYCVKLGDTYKCAFEPPVTKAELAAYHAVHPTQQVPLNDGSGPLYWLLLLTCIIPLAVFLWTVYCGRGEGAHPSDDGDEATRWFPPEYSVKQRAVETPRGCSLEKKYFSNLESVLKKTAPGSATG